MRKFEYVVSKVPSNNKRQAEEVLKVYGDQGFEIKHTSGLVNNDVFVIFQREVEVSVGKAKKAARKSEPKPAQKKRESEKKAEEKAEEEKKQEEVAEAEVEVEPEASEE